MEQEQAVLDEGQVEVVETQGTEIPATETDTSIVESAPTENTESDGVQKRINKLTAEKYGEKRRADALQSEIEQLKQSSPVVEKNVPQGKPKLEDFDFNESEYQAALISFEVDQRINAKAEQTQREQTQASKAKIQQAYNASEVQYATANPDYLNDVQTLPQFNADTLNMIQGQPDAPKLVHYLAKNPELAHSIASLDPYNAAVQVGIAITKLSATETPAVQTSTAPAPIDPINTGSSLPSEQKGPAGATYE